MSEHRLKTWPEFFAAVRSGVKTFELRRDDRGFEIGDQLFLEEFNPANNKYTGNIETRDVSYVARNLPEEFGLKTGYGILGFERD